jgi:hypothetical protein
MPDFVISVMTPLGFVVRCTAEYWRFISSQKHPSLRGREQEVEEALRDPDEVRRSRKDSNVSFSIGEAPRAGFARSRGGKMVMVSSSPPIPPMRSRLERTYGQDQNNS